MGLAARAARDVEGFYAAAKPPAATETHALVISADGKGIVMRPGEPGEATKRAAQGASHEFKTPPHSWREEGPQAHGRVCDRRRLDSCGGVSLGAARCFYQEADPAGEKWVAERALAVSEGNPGIVAGSIRRDASIPPAPDEPRRQGTPKQPACHPPLARVDKAP